MLAQSRSKDIFITSIIYFLNISEMLNRNFNILKIFFKLRNLDIKNIGYSFCKFILSKTFHKLYFFNNSSDNLIFYNYIYI